MRYLILLLALVSAFSFGGVIILDVQTRNQNVELARLRAQGDAQERSDRAAVASLNSAYARAERALSAATARIGGTHRDLITCADWQQLFLPVSGVDSLNGQISASAGPASLPSHCINQ